MIWIITLDNQNCLIVLFLVKKAVGAQVATNDQKIGNYEPYK